MSQDKTNRGTLGRNKRKEKDTHPEYSGKINVEGVEYWLSGWVKEGNGERFFSLSLKRKEPRPESTDDAQDFRRETTQTFGRDRAPLNDDIPF